jgi:conjugal transfer ATP-binding protein TraC
MNLLDKIIKKPVSSTNTETNVKKTGEEKNFVEGLVSTKDIIAPSSLEVDFDHIKIGSRFYRTLFVAGYPRFVGMNWLSPLINFDASLSISMYIYPTDGKEILDDLRRKIAEMSAEISTDIQRGRLANPATQAKLEDAMNLQSDLVKGEERFFQFGLYITISTDSKEELNRINKNLEAALGSLLIISKKATLQMEDGFISTLPAGVDKLNIARNMDTTSLATTFPFVSSDLSDDKGIMYGINEHNGSLIIFDRFSMPNYNSVVFATAGAGKSYMIKLEVLRSLMLGTEIIVVDPENEYKSLCDSTGGQYIAFGYDEQSKINPFDLSLAEEEGENALNSKVLSLHKLFKVMLGAMDPIEESILDRAIMDAYKMKGITPDVETQNKEPPLIEDLYKSLIGMEDKQAQNLTARLEKYIKGSFAGIFNQKTTVDLKNKFVVFGIKNLEETLRPVAMHIILDYIWTVVKRTLKKRILVVDEAWYLMQYEDSASFLRGIVKRGRKYYLGVTTITQDVDDFLQTAYGKEIVTNSSIQILLKQHSAAIDQIGEVFYLSEGEKQLLLSATKGEGIFFAGQNHVAIKVIASEDEHLLITSNPEEVLKMKQNSVKQNVKEEIKLLPKKEVNLEIKNTELKNEIPEEIKPVETIKTPENIIKNEIPVPTPTTKPIEIQKPQQNIVKIEPIIRPAEIQPIENRPKFEPPKVETVQRTAPVINQNKPLFISTVEQKIPQPSQFAKTQRPSFETNIKPNIQNKPLIVDKPLIINKPVEPTQKPILTNNQTEKKMTYEEMFGNQ